VNSNGEVPQCGVEEMDSTAKSSIRPPNLSNSGFNRIWQYYFDARNRLEPAHTENSIKIYFNSISWCDGPD
jgi:hypothetical protein